LCLLVAVQATDKRLDLSYCTHRSHPFRATTLRIVEELIDPIRESYTGNTPEMAQVPRHQRGPLCQRDARDQEIGSTQGARVWCHSQLLKSPGGIGRKRDNEQIIEQ